MTALLLQPHHDNSAATALKPPPTCLYAPAAMPLLPQPYHYAPAATAPSLRPPCYCCVVQDRWGRQLAPDFYLDPEADGGEGVVDPSEYPNLALAQDHLYEVIQVSLPWTLHPAK